MCGWGTAVWAESKQAFLKSTCVGLAGAGGRRSADGEPTAHGASLTPSGSELCGDPPLLPSRDSAGPWSRFRGCAPEGKSRILAAVPDRRRRLLHAVPAAALTVQVDGLTPPWEPLAGPGSRAPPAFLLPAALHAPTRGGCQGPPFPWRAGGLTPEAGLFKWGTRLSTQETSQTTGISPKKGSAAGSPGAAGPRQKTSKWGD